MKKRTFSLSIYLLVVFALSWPFQIAYIFLGENFRPILLISMVMAGVATFICSRYIFGDFRSIQSGWSWGKPRYYALAFAVPLLLWLVPVLIEQWFGLHKASSFHIYDLLITFLMSFAITCIPALGEEFSWRGYLLPKLLKTYTPRKALLIHGFITWFWHLPVIVALGLNIQGNHIVAISGIALISLIPTIMHAIVFAFFWSVSNSLIVATMYHSAFDETRDTLQGSIGFGPLVEIWQMILLTIMGLVFLWKIKWLKA